MLHASTDALATWPPLAAAVDAALEQAIASPCSCISPSGRDGVYFERWQGRQRVGRLETTGLGVVSYCRKLASGRCASFSCSLNPLLLKLVKELAQCLRFLC